MQAEVYTKSTVATYDDYGLNGNTHSLTGPSVSWDVYFQNNNTSENRDIYNFLTYTPGLYKIIKFTIMIGFGQNDGSINYIRFYSYMYENGNINLIVKYGRMKSIDGLIYTPDIEETNKIISNIMTKLNELNDITTFEYQNNGINVNGLYIKNYDFIKYLLSYNILFDKLTLLDYELPYVDLNNRFDLMVYDNKYKLMFEKYPNLALQYIENHINEYPTVLDELSNEPQLFPYMFQLANNYLEYIEEEKLQYDIPIILDSQVADMYYHLANMMMAIPNPTDEERDIILEYLFKAGDSEDVKRLRTRLFYERIGKSGFDEPQFEINLDYKTLYNLATKLNK